MALKNAEIGKTTWLKSGGPRMTIVAMSKENDTRVCCGWFDNAGLFHDNWFHTDTLVEKQP